MKWKLPMTTNCNPSEGAGRRPDDNVKVRPSHEWGHAVTSKRLRPQSSLLSQSGDVLGRRTPEEAAVFSAEL